MRKITSNTVGTLLLALFASSCSTRTADTPILAPRPDGLSPKEAPVGASVQKQDEDPALVMKKFTELFAPAQIVPNGKGVNPEVLSALITATQSGNHSIKELKDALAKAGDPAKPPTGIFVACGGHVSIAAWEINAVLNCLANAYAVAKPDEAETIKLMTCNFCRQILELKAGANDMRTIFSLGLGPKEAPKLDSKLAQLKGKHTIFAMRKELAESGLLEPMMDTLLWWGNPNSFFTKNPPQPQGPNESGRLFQYLEQFDVWAAMAVLPDSQKKYRYLKMMQAHLSNLIEGGAFCPAGEMIYHGGFHMAYAFAMPTKFGILLKMKKTGLLVSPEAQKRLKAYGRMNAFIAMDNKMALNLLLRPGKGVGGRYFDTVQIADLLGTQDQTDEELAGLFLGCAAQHLPQPKNKDDWFRNRDLGKAAPIVERYQQAGIKPAVIEGCLVLPARPGLIWRNNDWMLSVAGLRPDFGGIEMYGWIAPTANASACNGSVLAMRKGNVDELAVGYVLQKGWNWSLWPAATTLMKTDAETTARQSVIGAGNRSPIGGALSIGQGKTAAGLFAYRHEACDYQKDLLDFNKSVFVFNGRALVLTSGISSQANFPCVTTLYQEYLATPPKVMGEIQLASSFSAPSGMGYTLLPLPGAKPESKPVAHAFNRHQAWRTPSPSTLKPGVSASSSQLLYLLGFTKVSPLPKKPAVAPTMDDMLNDFVAEEGDFAVAYFDHGIKPIDASCAFLMSVHGVPQADVAHVKVLEKNRHCAYDTQAQTWIYAGFEPETTWKDCGRLIQMGRPASMVIQETDANTIQLAIASWNEKNKAPYTLTLLGRWSVTQGQGSAEERDGNTLLTIPYSGDAACSLALKQLKTP